MAKVRIRRNEMNLIAGVADRMAKRMHARFVIDNERVEVVDDEQPNGSNQPSEEDPLRS